MEGLPLTRNCDGHAARVTLLNLEYSDDDEEFHFPKNLAFLKNENYMNLIAVNHLV